MESELFILEDSPLRRLPADLSRKQMLIFDGVRYAAEMAAVAYERLFDQLQRLAGSATEPTTREIASCFLDAWSIVDSVHRFHELAVNAPGVSGGTWRRLLGQRVKDALDVRDHVQHLRSEIDKNGGASRQVWGYLNWAEVRGGRHTGRWLIASPGSVFRGDRWVLAGPAKAIPGVPIGRIRLIAFEREIYLGKCLLAVRLAIEEICRQFDQSRIRLVGSANADRRGSDAVYEGWIEVLVATRPSDPRGEPGS